MKYIFICLFIVVSTFTSAIEVESKYSKKDVEQARERMDRFDLYTDCRPIQSQFIAVYEGKEKAVQLVERKLRQAGIFTYKESDIYLTGSFLVRTDDKIISNIRFNKYLFDRYSQAWFPSTTWSDEEVQKKPTTKTAKINLENGLSILSQQIDKFIAEYLRVNESSCRKRGILK